ncbi:MAG: hypothetical protein M3O67_00140 [Bacteroidota bacterium]|nr:hypothetical protein [Bacteroidota bacterium]
MEQKIQLKHPAGKHAVSIDKDKYDTIKKALVNSLKKKVELTHKEILQAITEDFKKNKIKFEGSLEWYMESIKLDLEAGKIIERIPGKSPQKFRLSK